jgi:hypothetical protein
MSLRQNFAEPRRHSGRTLGMGNERVPLGLEVLDLLLGRVDVFRHLREKVVRSVVKTSPATPAACAPNAARRSLKNPPTKAPGLRE